MCANKINYYLVNTAKIVLSQHYCFNMTAKHWFKRRLSTIIPISEINEEKQIFQDARKYIVSAIETNEKLTQQPEVCAWVQKTFDYNTSGNHKMRGLTTVLTYKLLEKPKNITEEKLKLIHIIGWIIEMYQAYIILLDDIMDGSTTRRGKLCWYRVPGVGLGALNDSTLMNCIICDVLKKYFANTKYYLSILHLFNEYLLRLSIGQYLDLKKVHKKQNGYALFTTELYESVVKYKSTIFSIELPVLAAIVLIEDREDLPIKDIKQICCDIGILLQLQNDILDCYGDKTSGKDGRDIQEGKCTWLAVQAIRRCDQRQRVVFTEYYGSQEPEHVERIKSLYNELHLLDLFKDEEKTKFESIMKQIRALPADISPIFHYFIEIHKKKSLAIKAQSFQNYVGSKNN